MVGSRGWTLSFHPHNYLNAPNTHSPHTSCSLQVKSGVLRIIFKTPLASLSSPPHRGKNYVLFPHNPVLLRTQDVSCFGGFAHLVSSSWNILPPFSSPDFFTQFLFVTSSEKPSLTPPSTHPMTFLYFRNPFLPSAQY